MKRLIAPPMLAYHQYDGSVPEKHPPGTAQMPHEHIIAEADNHDLKQRLALHIDRWHTPTRR